MCIRLRLKVSMSALALETPAAFRSTLCLLTQSYALQACTNSYVTPNTNGRQTVTIDIVLSCFNMLHCKRPISISLHVISSDLLTLPLSLCRTVQQFHTFSPTHSRSHALKMAIDNMCQLEALITRLDQDRAALQQPVDTSPRTPNTISTQFNAADNIERQLHVNGHCI